MLPVSHGNHLVFLGDRPEIDVLKGPRRLMLAETTKEDAKQHGSHIIILQDKPKSGTIVVQLWLTVAVSLRRDEPLGYHIA